MIPLMPNSPDLMKNSVKRMGLLLAIMTMVAGNLNAGPEEQQIVDTVSTVFAAALTDDVAKFDSVISPDFYIFDGGIRFNGNAVMDLIKSLHAAGKRYEWNVTEPDVHINGDSAWIAYVNKGSITDASGTKNQNWLESAFLEKRAGNWKIVFMQSTRVPAAPPENHGK
jgi:ketosteroid isomerase-like protein